MGNIRKIAIIFICFCVIFFLALAAFTIFFDQAVLVRKGTVYRVNVPDKVVALTFDDGPSPVWTPKILDELKRANVKATFFMLGQHVQQYPEIAKRVAAEGHEIENHSYDHHTLFYYKPHELEREIRDAENVIRSVTGQTPRYFRPPKAWLNDAEKKQINGMGYRVVLWSLNSKDWVTFDDKYIHKFIIHHVRPGDIILFHDSGGIFTVEGGNRQETVKTIFRLVEQLKGLGYRCVTVDKLLAERDNAVY
jgi:peptidoglycan/xylan/chitin deacetylase (PgdA/CDA1 family)